MCGRYSITISLDRFIKLFILKPPHPDSLPDWPARYNIAPTQEVPVIRKSKDGSRQLNLFRWGLIPSWAKEPPSGLINARSETVNEKPTFRYAFRHQRCIIPASGFYEWKKVGKQKVPYYIRLVNGDPMAFAGIWETWASSAGEVVESCAILTTCSNELVTQLHDRMPVILKPETFDLWLDPEIHDPEVLMPLLIPSPSEDLVMHPVSTFVNKVGNDSPECVVEVREAGVAYV